MLLREVEIDEIRTDLKSVYVEKSPDERGFSEFYRKHLALIFEELDRFRLYIIEKIKTRLIKTLPFFFFALFLYIFQFPTIEVYYESINMYWNRWHNSLPDWLQYFVPAYFLLWSFRPFTLVLLLVTSFFVAWSFFPISRYLREDPYHEVLPLLIKYIRSENLDFSENLIFDAVNQSRLIPDFDRFSLDANFTANYDQMSLELTVAQIFTETRANVSLSSEKYYVFRGLIVSLQNETMKLNANLPPTILLMLSKPRNIISELKNRLQLYRPKSDLPDSNLQNRFFGFYQNNDALLDKLVAHEKFFPLLNEFANNIDTKLVTKGKSLDSSHISDMIGIEIKDDICYISVPMITEFLSKWSIFRKPEFQNELRNMLVSLRKLFQIIDLINTEVKGSI